MSAPVIAVIDNGICNLRSVTKALEVVGATPRVVRTPEEVAASDAVGLVLPGVGALRDCVAALRATKLDATVRDWIEAADYVQRTNGAACTGLVCGAGRA